jgi:hypothetical protein
LIVLIANVHPHAIPRDCRERCHWQKRPASRDLFDGAVRQTNHVRGIERPARRTADIITRPLTEVYGSSRTRFR